MRALRDWFTVTVPSLFSAWLLRAYRRPVAFLLGLVIAPMALLILGTGVVSVSLWRRQALTNLGVTARLAAEIMDGTLEESFRFEEMLATQPGFAEALQRGDTAHLSRQLGESLAFIPRVNLALVISPQGQVIAESPDRPDLVGRSLAQEEPFLGAREGGWHPYLSGVYLRDTASGDADAIEKVVGVVWPVTQDGVVVGVIQFQHQVEEVKSWLQKIRVDPEGFLYVVDHHQQLVVFPFQVLPGKPKVVADWPPVARPLSAAVETMAFRDQRSHRRWLAGMSPVSATGWRVVAVQPDRAALRVLYRVLWPLGLIAAFLGLLLIALSLRWAKLQAFSLRLLNQNTKLLKQMQQRRTFDRGQPPEPPMGGGG